MAVSETLICIICKHGKHGKQPIPHTKTGPLYLRHQFLLVTCPEVLRLGELGLDNISLLQHCVYRVATMRNRASNTLSKGVCIYYRAYFPQFQMANKTLFRKSVNHGANTTCITCNDSAAHPPPIAHSSSKNGLPRLPRVPTTASKSARDSGNACSTIASAVLSP